VINPQFADTEKRIMAYTLSALKTSWFGEGIAHFPSFAGSCIPSLAGSSPILGG